MPNYQLAHCEAFGTTFEGVAGGSFEDLKGPDVCNRDFKGRILEDISEE